jgi:hypothetical protein
MFVTGSIVTFYGGEILNKVEMFTAFGSETPPASPFSPRHTIDCGAPKRCPALERFLIAFL